MSDEKQCTQPPKAIYVVVNMFGAPIAPHETYDEARMYCDPKMGDVVCKYVLSKTTKPRTR